MSTEQSSQLYGLLAEFKNPDELVAATKRVRDEGYRKMDAFAPFPVEGLAEALEFRQTYMPLIILVGGIAGAIVGYGLQYYVSVIAYPVNVGGRPLNSIILFIPVTFEVVILGAALAGVFGMFILNGLPMPYHPLFNVPRFNNVAKDGFFLCIEAVDRKFNYDSTKEFLLSLQPSGVYDVPE